MKQQSYGRIVMTTSSSALYGNFGQSNYAAAKLSLVGLMQTLGLEGEKNNIRVNCLAPTAGTRMLHGLMTQKMLDALSPAAVSPGLLALVSEDAPNRAILCAGAGSFERAYITLTRGVFIGSHEHAADKVLTHWSKISDRTNEFVPEAGSVQGQLELEKAGFTKATGNEG